MSRQALQSARWLVAIVTSMALLLMLAPHGRMALVSTFSAMLPVVFVGLTVFVCLLLRVESMRLGVNPDNPGLPSAFQRPPPFRNA